MISQSSLDGDVHKPQHVEINAIVLYITTFFQSTGASLIWPITTLYMHNILHKSMTVSGMVVMGLSVAMMVGNWLGGKLFDRWNPFETMVISVSIALATLVTLTFWNSWPVFAFLMLLSGFADGLIYTLINSYATTIQTIDTRKVFNLQYLFMNVGVVAGTAVVGFLFDYGANYVFGGAAVMYAVFLILVLKYFNVKGLAKQSARAAAKAAKTTFKTPVVIYAILGLAFAFYMAYILWETVIATHMTDLGMTTKDYSFLWTLNGIIIIFGQGILDRFIDRLPLRWTVLTGSTLFAISFLVLIQATTYPMFIISIVILTFGEILASPQIPAWIDALSDPNAKGHAQGWLTMFISLGRAIGPLYGGLLIDSGSYKLLFMSIFIIMMFFIILTWLLNHRHVSN